MNDSPAARDIFFLHLTRQFFGLTSCKVSAENGNLGTDWIASAAKTRLIFDCCKQRLRRVRLTSLDLKGNLRFSSNFAQRSSDFCRTGQMQTFARLTWN